MPDSPDTTTPQLSLCWGSMEGVGFDEFLSCAAGAGFNAVTLNSALYLEAQALGYSDNDVANSLMDNGLFVSDIDPLFNWLPSSLTLAGADAISLCTQASAADVFHLAHVAGTDLVNAPLGMATPADEQEIVDCFAALCEQAAGEGLRVSLEFMPFNQVSNLATAARIIALAGQANGGIMFDCWHHHRGGGSPEEILAVPGEHYFAVQLDDALPEPMEDVLDETLNHRLLPGEGVIDLQQTVQNLQASNPALVYDVEVFKAPLRALPAAERARQMFETSSSIWREA